MPKTLGHSKRVLFFTAVFFAGSMLTVLVMRTHQVRADSEHIFELRVYLLCLANCPRSNHGFARPRQSCWRNMI